LEQRNENFFGLIVYWFFIGGWPKRKNQTNLSVVQDYKMQLKNTPHITSSKLYPEGLGEIKLPFG